MDSKPVKLLEALSRYLETAQPSVAKDNPDLAAGFIRGTIAKLMRGRLKLRVHHVQSLGTAFGFTIVDAFWEAYGRVEGSERLTGLFTRLLVPEIERMLIRGTPIASPDVLQKRFSRLPIEEP